jgi:hypothetical protein
MPLLATQSTVCQFSPTSIPESLDLFNNIQDDLRIQHDILNALTQSLRVNQTRCFCQLSKTHPMNSAFGNDLQLNIMTVVLAEGLTSFLIKHNMWPSGTF